MPHADPKKRKEYQKWYNKIWTQKNRKRRYELNKKSRNKIKQYIKSLKSCGCQICGYNKCSNALAFHHKDPFSKEHAMADIPNFGLQRASKELDKCIVVCLNCHMEIHRPD